MFIDPTPWTSYESYLASEAGWFFDRADDASFGRDFALAADFWETGERIWDKAMKAAAHGA